ncbi:MAG: zinc-binding dehydrogenase [Anaerolineae bacterium]|nr:zinc-binding dehydrogenase [Anaerolineae bacterium]
MIVHPERNRLSKDCHVQSLAKTSGGSETVADLQFQPVIDCCYPLEQIVEAHRCVDQGHKRGNVVVMVE